MDADTPQPKRARWPWWLLAVAVLAAAVGAWYLLASSDGDGGAPRLAATELSFAEVQRTDLVTVETFDGTLGYTDGDRILASRSGTLTGLAAEGSTVAPGEVLFAVDGDPAVLLVGAVPAWRDLGLTVTERPVLARAAGTVTAAASEDDVLEQGDVLFTVDDRPVVLLYGDTPAWRTMQDDDIGTDVLQLETALVALGYDPDGTVTVDDEFTSRTEQMVERWQEDLGYLDDDVDGIVRLGDVVFLPGPAEVNSVLSEAGSPVGAGTAVLGIVDEVETIEGDDVAQLEAALEALGFGGAGLGDGVFDSRTEQAVLAWQRAVGADDDGVVHLGEAVFLPEAVRIGEHLIESGTAVGPGTAVLATSSTGTLVRLDLPTDQQDLLAPGDQVTVIMPDETEEPAVVTSIGSVATTNAQGQSTFEVTITLENPDAGGGLDEAPVDVEVLDEAARNVLAVPVTALLALAEGGYAVEVGAGPGQTRLVAVEPGLYADGLVEIDAVGLEPGDRVVVP